MVASSYDAQSLRSQDAVVRAGRGRGRWRRDHHCQERSPNGEAGADPAGAPDAWTAEGQDLDFKRLRRADAGNRSGVRGCCQRRRSVFMKLILDTHAVLWWLNDDRKLSREARTGIATAERVWVSAGSGWEVAVKKARG